MADKLTKLKEQHQIEEHQFLTDEHKQQQRDNALMILGGIRVADKIATSISSQVMNALITFQDERMYLNFGFDNFVDFLQNSEVSPMSKGEFYKRKEIFEAEGEKLFDLMNEVGVSFATRKLLSSGNYDAISFDGDKLKIGDQEADISNARLVRALLESYADDYKRVKTESEKAKVKLKTAEGTITSGYQQIELLQKQLDGGKESYDSVLTKLIVDLSSFAQIVEKLSDPEKKDKADFALRTLSHQFSFISDAFGMKKTLTTGENIEVDGLTQKVLDEGFDD